MDSVTVTIDGRALTVDRGKTVLQAALENGIHIPFYCYHPALGVDGSCRVCLVRIENVPKLQTACSTRCTDGMVVETSTPEVVEARAAVFEFLLLNHPLDCPVCDKGGECPLQDYSAAYGPARSRTDFPRRVFDGEGVTGDVDFGPTLLLNRNRCILCSRCVRFMRDIDGDAQIGTQDRGHGSQIVTFQEDGVRSLLSGNLADVCPVGAITTRDYRFKSRPWDNPTAVDTLCTLCAKGCSTTVWLRAKPEWAKGPRLARVTPRPNPDANGFWMCDIGRFGYHVVEGDDRIRQPLVRDRQGEQTVCGWHEALVRLREVTGAANAEARRAIRFIASAHASIEALALLGTIARRVQGEGAERNVGITWRCTDKPQPARTTFRIPRVDAPNVQGARDLGLRVDITPEGTPDLRWLQQAVEAGAVCALYVFDPGPAGTSGDPTWLLEARRSGRVAALIVHAVVMSDLVRAADVVLPGATAFEEDACFTNEQGLVQPAARVVAPPGDAMENAQALMHAATALGVALGYESAAQVRAELAAAMHDRIGYAGLARMAFGQAHVARNPLDVSNPAERRKWDELFKDLPPVKQAPA